MSVSDRSYKVAADRSNATLWICDGELSFKSRKMKSGGVRLLVDLQNIDVVGDVQGGSMTMPDGIFIERVYRRVGIAAETLLARRT